MSSSAAINTFRNGDTSTANFTSMQQTILQVLRDKDNFELYNFGTGNSAVPGITAGSIVGVNYVLYPFDTTELAQYLSTSGVVSDASNAPDGDYAIIAKPFILDDISYCSIYIYPYTSGQIVYEPTYGHYIISGTTNRVLGTCVKSGSAYSRKRLFVLNGTLPDSKMQIYQEGADIYGNHYGYAAGETDSKIILNSTHTHGIGAITGTVTITHPCGYRLEIAASGSGGSGHITWCHYRVGFTPVANIGSYGYGLSDRVLTVDNVSVGHDDVIIYRGSFNPGVYRISHEFTKRYTRDNGSYNIEESTSGTMWITSTLYVGNVYGSITGKIL